MSEALARHRLYALLGALIADGPRPDLLGIGRRLPALADALAGDPDTLAASHHAALARELSAHESVFLGDEGLLGGPIASEVRSAYQRGGSASGRRDLEPDHLGLELAFLGHLSAVEADADAHARADLAASAREAARAFLDDHLLRWLPVVAAALEADAPGPWATVVALSTELAASHRAADRTPPPPWALPAASIDLASPETGLKQIATFLLRPARSGWIATSAAIGAAAAELGLPTGFGSRADRLTTMIHAAGDHGRLPAWCEALDRRLVAQGDALARITGPLGLGAHVGPWDERRTATRRLLGQLATEAVRGTGSR